jgi:curved DNA-binding protein CbpA
MKPTSKYFDSIRAKSAKAAAAEPKEQLCQWKGCTNPGKHRAPMGRAQEGAYYSFCYDHVRQYNASYNYFSGMSDKDVATFQKDALTGHRPTWKLGGNASSPASTGGNRWKKDKAAPGEAGSSNDPHNFFSWRAKRVAGDAETTPRYVKPLERKSLEALHLPETASKAEIKSRFKDLVKQHHPDANGGDRRSEEKLREIIQAYNHLKAAGMV